MAAFGLDVIGFAKSLDRSETDGIRKMVNYRLPDDYIDFLEQYGFGEVCHGDVSFTKPNPDMIKEEYGEILDLMDWCDSEKEIDLFKNGLAIGSSMDGDLIACINDKMAYGIIPRQDVCAEYYTSFADVLAKYIYKNDRYYLSFHQRKNENISLIRNDSLDKRLVDVLHKVFLKHHKPDGIFHTEEQPYYIINKLGGYVYFDFIYRNNVAVSYQEPYNDKANRIILQLKEIIEHQ